MAHIIDKESKATAQRNERAIQDLHNDHDDSTLKLQYDLNQYQHLREKSESELAVARAKIAEALKKIHAINLNRSLLQSDRDEALAAESSMLDAYQQLVKEKLYLIKGHDKATKGARRQRCQHSSASTEVVSLRIRLRTQKQEKKEANMKSGLLLQSKDEKIRRLSQ